VNPYDETPYNDSRDDAMFPDDPLVPGQWLDGSAREQDFGSAAPLFEATAEVTAATTTACQTAGTAATATSMHPTAPASERTDRYPPSMTL